MTAEDIRQAITSVPFLPFKLNVADGRSIPVVGRDFILVSPLGRMVTVYQPDDRFDWLSIPQITGLSFEPSIALTSASQPSA
jgi:hypothetical protein